MRPSASRVASRHLLTLMASRVAGAFEDAVEGKKFKNPETGNEVQFDSLPKGEQERLRSSFRKRKQMLEKAKPDKSMAERVESLGKKAKAFLDDAPEAVSQFVTDSEYRKEALSSAADSLREAPGKVAKNFVDAAKEEAENFTRAGEGVANILRGENVSVAQKQAFKNVAKRVAIGVAGVVLAGTTGPLAAAGAFCKALVQGIAVKAVSKGIDDLSSVSEELGLVGAAISHIAAEKKPEKKLDAGEVIGKYVELKVAEAIEGLTDDDVIGALETFDEA